MANKEETSKLISQFLGIANGNIETFSNQNPELQIFVSIAIGDDLKGGYQTLISGRKTSLKEQLRLLDGIKSNLIADEVNKFSEFLNETMSQI